MTIYDIAKEAGCSASTVSRVINNKPGIRRETRERVRELLEKYNYTPDIAARGLVKQSSGLIGILIEDLRVLHHLESAFIIESGFNTVSFDIKSVPVNEQDGLIYFLGMQGFVQSPEDPLVFIYREDFDDEDGDDV